MNYPNQNNPNPFGNAMGSYPVPTAGYGQPQQPQSPYGQQPQQTQQALPGMYGQPQPSLGYGQQPQQQQQQPAYPSWFAQVTGVDPVYMDQTIMQGAAAMIGKFFQTGLAQRISYQPQTAQNPLQSPEILQILPLVRQAAIIFLLGGRGIQLPQAIERAVAVVFYGDAVARMGGETAYDLQQWDMVLGVQLLGYYTNFMSIRNNPQLYQSVIQTVAQRLVQQVPVQGAGGYGGISSAHVNPNAIPSQPFSYTQGLPQPPQAMTDPISMIGRVASSGTNPQTASTTDLYSLANNAKKQHMAEQVTAQQAQQYAQPVQNAPVTQPVVIPTTSDDITVKRVSGGVSTAIDPYSFLLNKGNDKPKAVIPTGWADRVMSQHEEQQAAAIPAEHIAQPTPVVEAPTNYEQPPATGLPSAGYYGFQAGQQTTMDDYQTPASVESHVENAPAASNTFEDEAGPLEEDEFYSQITAIEEAEIQAEHELLRQTNPMEPIDSMDSLLDQAREQGMEVSEPVFEQDYMAIDPVSRNNICRVFKLRIVPAYVKGEQHLIHISKGKRREIIIKRVDDVDYNTHETVAHKTSVFANWDEEALNIQVAKTAMLSAVDTPTWTEKFFLEKLEEKLAEDDQADADVVLGDLVADRQIIEIEELVPSRTAVHDYQTEVINELLERGVEQAGTLVDNAVVKYQRFESTCLVLNEENKNLIETVVQSEKAATVIENLIDFKRECTLPLREIARLAQIFTHQVNNYLLTELSNGWKVDDALTDFNELQQMAVRSYAEEKNEEEVNAILDRIYCGAAKFALATAMVGGAESIGHKSVVTLLPFYYSQYPIAYMDQAGAILKADHPELYELLNKLNTNEESAEVKLVTLDNVVLTFLRSLGDDGLYFLVDIKK